MTTLENGTWVLIADGEKALVLENVTDHENPNLQVRRLKEHENPPARDWAASAPGRMHESAGHGSRSYAETDWHRFEKERFAADLADMLYADAVRGRFRRLVLVAAPHVLGDIRAALHGEVQGRIVAEIGKTLTNHPLPEIEKIVKTALESA